MSNAAFFRVGSDARSPSIAVGILLFWMVYYGWCLFPGIGGMLNAGDSAKFQTLGHTSILVHGPGYPFILMLGSLVRSLALPVEPWWAMTFAMAAVPGAIANALAFLITRRLTGSVVFGLASATLLGSAGLMAVQSTEAEVYPLALAFVFGIVFLMLRFIETKRSGYFVAACGLYALSFGNHLMMVMLAPVGLWVMVAHAQILLRPRILGAIALLLCLGATQYLYLFWVTHQPTTAYSEYMPLPPTAGEVVNYIAGTYFGDLYGAGLASTQTMEVLIGTFSYAHPGVSIPVMAVGLSLFVAGWRQRGRDWAWYGVALVLGTGLAFTPFMLWYGAYDIRAFHLPVLGPLLVGTISAIGWWAAKRPHPRLWVSGALLIFGLVRTVQMAGDLTERTAPFADLVPVLETVIPQSPVEDPLVSMTYFMRMATLYHELQGETPMPATYRVAWRIHDEVERREQVGGIVIPTDGEQALRWIEHQRPDLHCEVVDIEQPERASWPAYGFLCSPPETTSPITQSE
ncbi:DUF2723 domain-containing protein [Gymnodinialimonas sp. 2305UL16-5]|uniref:protein O-mannosyl-transferase family n=1 Tax=Gymnodinialimonas mytili TaxID=3126503 RepID=UPI00309550BD